MPDFTITRHIEAPIDTVWQVLDDFGDIQRWNDGVKASRLTSDGPVGAGSTRHCDFTPLGGVDERIIGYEPPRRMTIDLYETFKLPISRATADFNLAEDRDGTELTLHYTYTLNLIGRAAKGVTDGQLRKGLGGLVDGLAAESQRLASA